MITIQLESIAILGEYGTHLKNLTQDDRYTRFCYNANDEQIDKFILQILYNQHDHHLFVAKEGDAVIGFGHLAREGNDWELAVSVDSDKQGRGVGDQLMSFMIPWAKVHGVHNVFMHCITRNQKIQHLAIKHGLRTVDRDGSEITSKVELPTPTPMDYTAEFLKEQRDLYKQIQTLQHQMVQNLNPFIFVKERTLD